MNEELAALGSAVRRFRHARSISQEALGGLSDLHRTYICDIERGARNVSFLSLMKLARALGVTVSEIIRDAEVSRPLPLAIDDSKCTAPEATPAMRATWGNGLSCGRTGKH
jgi:transcriptional regulator with XRE-family HTH domain